MSIPTITDIAGIINAPELRYTQSGKAVLSMRLAFNDSKYDDQQRKWVTTKSFYVDAQAWEQTAERLAETLTQGEQVYVVGRLETQQWEKDGEKKSKPVLNLQTVRKLAKAEPQQAQQPRSQQASQDDPWATPAVANTGGWGNQSDPAF
ncbi:single-stranded DNA-binding protein [Paenarthrobacter sp. JL.01a]|uniref:single-stranded DNA-binding protein n=1 Tax=Paenarthrobacter sp. JL.01a TaxID=2979324 RepID=UPI0021CA71AA|nr:single-stranded DNA-binding protein [Paenarthrobacter sp. JL.01a]UXM90915.1 single-stranded DNA-binding protein [Paenarthrobacter sp. JL.01a]